MWLFVAALLISGCNRSDPAAAVATGRAPSTEKTEVAIRRVCSACHAFPPPDTFPKRAWDYEVEQAYRFIGQANMPLAPPLFDDVVKYFEARAPEELPPAIWHNAAGPPPVAFERRSFQAPPHKESPAISNVKLVHLFDKDRLDVLACDMRRGRVMVLSPYAAAPAWKVLAEVPNPAHVEVVDLDKDGNLDILVANLGSFLPTDSLKGSVVWLRGRGDGTFVPITLFDGIGRVADVQYGDFNGDGKLDLIVAAFGWNGTGEIWYLENKTTDWDHPRFEPHKVDERHGTIHVPVADLDGDGRPDFVALISQEHETIVAFLNDGKGHFTKRTLYTGPHPGYGSSGIELVDLNGDKRPDILYTNGDTLDKPYLLKPYHGIQWLENKGDLNFEHHPLTPMYGVHRAVAADFDGDGLPDIVAVGFLPEEGFPMRKERALDAVIFLHQVAPGKFERHSLENVTCDHVTCDVGDIFHSGHIDFVTGNFVTGKDADSVTIWRNLGRSH
jgi:hypothetical protein